MEKTLYGVRMDIYRNEKYVDTEFPSKNFLLETEESAWEYANQLAQDEADALNEGWVEPNPYISYGVVDKECNGDCITVNKYILESEQDETGDTELLTKYTVYEALL